MTTLLKSPHRVFGVVTKCRVRESSGNGPRAIVHGGTVEAVRPKQSYADAARRATRSLGRMAWTGEPLRSEWADPARNRPEGGRVPGWANLARPRRDGYPSDQPFIRQGFPRSQPAYSNAKPPGLRTNFKKKAARDRRSQLAPTEVATFVGLGCNGDRALAGDQPEGIRSTFPGRPTDSARRTASAIASNGNGASISVARTPARINRPISRNIPRAVGIL
jgi:hypothetical protein